MEKYVATIDIGSTEIRGVLAKTESHGAVTVIAHEAIKSEGVKRGKVVNIDLVARSVREIGLALAKASGKQIERFFVGTGGYMVYAKENLTAKVFSNKNEFSPEVINELNKSNNSVAFAEGVEVVSIKNMGYTIDDEFNVADPVGVSGNKIQGNYVVFGIAKEDKEMLRRSIEKAGFSLSGIIVSPAACAEAVLTDEEKQKGTVLVDMGAGKTSVVVYLGSMIKAMVVFPFGGNLVTNDISVGANIEWDKAEKAKQLYGSPMVDLQNNNLLIFNKSKSSEGKQLTFKTVAYIIEARMTEILANAFYQIKENVDLGMLQGGVVLTGGATKLKDLSRFVKLKYTLDVREGVVNNVKVRGLSSANESNHNIGSLSLSLWADSECTRKNEFKTLSDSKSKQAKKPKVERTGNLFGSLLRSVDNFFEDDDKKM